VWWQNLPYLRRIRPVYAKDFDEGLLEYSIPLDSGFVPDELPPPYDFVEDSQGPASSSPHSRSRPRQERLQTGMRAAGVISTSNFMAAAASSTAASGGGGGGGGGGGCEGG